MDRLPSRGGFSINGNMKYAEFLEAKKNEKVVTAKEAKRTAIQEDIDAASKKKQELETFCNWCTILISWCLGQKGKTAWHMSPRQTHKNVSVVRSWKKSRYMKKLSSLKKNVSRKH